METRTRVWNADPPRADGDYVLYWMTSARRTAHNHALDRAIALARELDRPLVVLEALRVGYQWACDRFHRFVLEGMADNRRAFEPTPVTYYPYVEREAGAGKGLLEALSERACAVIADDYPAFFLPRMIAAAGERSPVRFEAIDSNGLMPMRATDRVFQRAYDMRRFLQRELRPHLDRQPSAKPLARLALRSLAALPKKVLERWPMATADELEGAPDFLATLPIDHEVGVVDERGGREQAMKRLDAFVRQNLDGYGEGRNHPDESVSSELSPYLHFGHVSPHDVLARIASAEGWTPERFGGVTSGAREGWWGTSPPAEAFLDQLVTWRELGFQFAAKRDDAERYESLPDWARETLAEHERDERPYEYTLEQFDAARTHDELWNAAQNQLRESGRMHNYLRMLWGKKILHWSPDPRWALAVMIELNNRYALDGRDPNTSSGVFWVLGRYDRPWGPEREVFGKIRYMASENTRKKLRLGRYIEQWSGTDRLPM